MLFPKSLKCCLGSLDFKNSADVSMANATPRTSATTREEVEMENKIMLSRWLNLNLHWQAANDDLLNNGGAHGPQAELLFEQITDVSSVFLSLAETYGTMIIRELCLPRARKTIKPLDLGGIIGGTKYITHGILFKVQCKKSLAVNIRVRWRERYICIERERERARERERETGEGRRPPLGHRSASQPPPAGSVVFSLSLLSLLSLLFSLLLLLLLLLNKPTAGG
jgi:hypothetical protein